MTADEEQALLADDDASGMLLPLAYCDCLPLGPLWYAAVEALHRPLPPATIDAFVTGPGATFLEAVGSADGESFRLAHQELARSLRQQRDVTADRRRLLAAWRERCVPVVDGELRWEQAPASLPAQAVDLAADAGALDLLGADLTYLAAAPLTVWRDRLRDTDLRGPVRDLVEVVAERAEHLPPDRRATMLVLAARTLRSTQDLADRLIAVLRPAWEAVGVHHGGETTNPVPAVVPVVRPVLGTPWQQVYDAVSGRPVSVALLHEGGVQCADAFVLDGTVRVVTGGNDGSLQVWNAATGEATSARFSGHVGPVTGITIFQAERGTWIVSTGYNGTIAAHDIFTGDATMPTIHAQGSTAAVAAGLVGGARHIVTVGSERLIQLWDPRTGRSAGVLETDHTGAVHDVALVSFGGRTRIVTASEDLTVRVWDPDEHTCDGIIDCIDVPGLLAPLPGGQLGFEPSKALEAYVRVRPRPTR